MLKKELNADNEVIIIGADHHNTLAVIRDLGKHKVKNKIIVYGDYNDKNDIMISYSKYAKNLEFVKKDEKTLMDFLMKNRYEDKKQVLFPCTDFAEYVVDNNFSQLEPFFIMPGFKGKPGLVAKMMDKYEQKKWAEENGILMAKTWEIDLQKYQKDGLIFPCIIKPEISAFGKKGDIRIAYDEESFEKFINEYISKKYEKVIVQEFIKKQYEVCAFGCITNDGNVYGRFVKKIRENPPKRWWEFDVRSIYDR